MLGTTGKPKKTALFRAVAALAAAGSVFAVSAAPASADDPPPAPIKSNFETHYGSTQMRDCGYSERLPGSSTENLWVFCDTAVYSWFQTPYVDVPTRFIAGSTAARGPVTRGLAPTGLSEVPNPPTPLQPMPHHDGPWPFLSNPSDLMKSDGVTACVGDAYQASWPSGLARIPGTSRMLLTYWDVCVEGPWNIIVNRVGSVEYTPSTNTFGPKTTLFTAAPGQQLDKRLRLSSPVFRSDGNLYLFSFDCTQSNPYGCDTGNVFLARVAVASRHDWRQYRFRQGGGWTPTCGGTPTPSCWSLATSVITGAKPTDISVDNFSSVGRGLILVETTSIGGHYRVWEASDPAGPWTQRGAERQAPFCAPPPNVVDFCHALIGQPELSTTSSIAVSYYSVENARPTLTTSSW